MVVGVRWGCVVPRPARAGSWRGGQIRSAGPGLCMYVYMYTCVYIYIYINMLYQFNYNYTSIHKYIHIICI